MSRHNQFDDGDDTASDDDDEDNDLVADLQALTRACLPSDADDSTGAAPSSRNSGDNGGVDDDDSNSDADSADDDITTLRDLLQPLCNLYPDLSDGDENDDVETIEAIQRRFYAYRKGNLSACTKHDQDHSSVITTTSENRTSDSLCSNQIDASEEASSGGGGNHSIEWPPQIESKTFPKSCQFFMDAIKRNRCYQKILRSKLTQIEAKIEENKKLRERVGILKKFQVACRKITGRALSQKKDPHVQLVSRKKFSTNDSKASDAKCFPKKYGPEENSHVENYRDALAKFVTTFDKNKWSEAERENLGKGIKRQFQEMMLQVSINNSSCLDGSSGDGSTVDNICSSVKDRELTPEEIRKFLPKVNWDELASTYIQGRTGAECEARWLNCEDPLINHNPWSPEEERRLLYIIPEGGITNWVTIATLLGTNRTPFQCLVHYQRSLNVRIMEREWTPEEDEQLRAAVNTYGEKNWSDVASVLKRRTGPQCSNRWNKSLHVEKKGRWTMDEIKRLKVAVILLGPKNWNVIAQYVPGRSQAQCRERWVESLDPSLNFNSWTEEEDIILDNAVANQGYCWKSVAVNLPSRSRKQCMRRWKALHPDLVPLLQEARRKQKAVTISNFVDRECERPALGPNDLVPLPVLGPESEPLGRIKASKKRKRIPSRKMKPKKEKEKESCDPAEGRRSTRPRKKNQKYSEEFSEVNTDDDHDFIPSKRTKGKPSVGDNSLPTGSSEIERPSNENSRATKLPIRRAQKGHKSSLPLAKPSKVNLEIEAEDDNMTLAHFLAKISKKTRSNNGNHSKTHLLPCNSNLRSLEDKRSSIPNGVKPAEVHSSDYWNGAVNPEVNFEPGSSSVPSPCLLTYKRRKRNDERRHLYQGII
ncbi:hypothetical protein ACFE04_007891 [Oxalis oulophora]